MTKRLIPLLIWAPGLLAMAWLCSHALRHSILRPRKAVKGWPALGEALGFAFEPVESQGRTEHFGRLKGTHEGRAVSVEALMVRGSGSNNAASHITSWRTTTSCPLTVQLKQGIERLTEDPGVATGDAAFDKRFVVHGEAEQVAQALTPEVRAAISQAADALGEFDLSGGSLTSKGDSLILERKPLETVLAWHAWALDALEGKGASTIHPDPVPRMSFVGPYCLALLVLLGSGIVASRYQRSQTEEPPAAFQVGDRVIKAYQGTTRCYPAVVAEPGLVVYHDGEVEAFGETFLGPDKILPGATVVTLGDGAPMTVVDRKGDAVRLRFGEDPPVWTAASKLEVWLAKAMEMQATEQPAFAATAPIVLAPWKDEASWLYPGVVVGEEEGGKRVVFLDGTSDVRSAEQVRPLDGRKAGDPLQMRAGDAWVEATWHHRVEFALKVGLDGTTTRWTALAQVRFPAR